jgi:NAD(P)-dependent dehydrogenase (short-subunit alcohol dehydrogenase family)
VTHIRPYDLSGKVAIVTGGANGIGVGIAEILAEAGATVVIADRDAAGAQRQAEALVQGGHSAEGVAIDLGDEASIARGCAEAIAAHGTPWLLVNNAAVQDRQLLLEATAEEWDRINDVNARGPFLMTREIARAMVAGGKGGRIVNIGSIAVRGGITQGHAAYASSKTALLGLTNASALELVGHGITVNLVLPGGTVTPGSIGAKGPAPDGPARRPQPLGLCDPRDIGFGVLCFAVPAARQMTNQVLAVDAGFSIS